MFSWEQIRTAKGAKSREQKFARALVSFPKNCIRDLLFLVLSEYSH